MDGWKNSKLQKGIYTDLKLKAVEIVSEAGAQVIQHPDMGVPLELFDDMTADEAGSTCYKHFHSNFQLMLAILDRRSTFPGKIILQG